VFQIVLLSKVHVITQPMTEEFVFDMVHVFNRLNHLLYYLNYTSHFISQFKKKGSVFQYLEQNPMCKPTVVYFSRNVIHFRRRKNQRMTQVKMFIHF